MITIFHFQDKPWRTTLAVVPAENNPWYDPGSTSTQMRHRHTMHWHRFEALTLRVSPISTFLFPGAGSCHMPTNSNNTQAIPPGDERSQAMKKWAECRSHIQHLVDCDKTPQNEDCLLVFQCLMIKWCYISSYSSCLLKRFTVYEFVHFNKNGSFVFAVKDGTKFEHRTALKFNKFEKSVLTFFQTYQISLDYCTESPERKFWRYNTCRRFQRVNPVLLLQLRGQ